jgi:hypothetical protein
MSLAALFTTELRRALKPICALLWMKRHTFVTLV